MRDRVTDCIARTTVVLVAATSLSCQSRPSGRPLGTEEAKANLVAQAREMVEAIRTRDHAKLADRTHPKLIEKLGGREKYIQTVDKVLADMNRQGFQLTRAETGDPGDPVDAAGERYAIVPTRLTMTQPGGVKLRQAGYLIAASADGGRTWTFIDGAGISGDRGRLKELMPNFPDALALPPREQPVVEEPGK